MKVFITNVGNFESKETKKIKLTHSILISEVKVPCTGIQVIETLKKSIEANETLLA